MNVSGDEAVKLQSGDYRYDPIRWAVISAHPMNFSNSASAAQWLKQNIGLFAHGTLFRTVREADGIVLWDDYEIRRELGW